MSEEREKRKGDDNTHPRSWSMVSLVDISSISRRGHMSAVMGFVFVVEWESSWVCFHVLDLVGLGRDIYGNDAVSYHNR